MSGEQIDIWALLVNAPLAGLCIFFYREAQAAKKELKDALQKQNDLLLKAYMTMKGGENA